MKDSQFTRSADQQSPFPAVYPQTLLPEPPAPPKGSARLWILLAGVALALLIGGGLYAFFQMRSTPQKTLQTYCTALQNADAQGLYTTLTSEAQAKNSVHRIQTELRLLTLLANGIKDCVVNSDSIQIDGTIATGSVTITSNGHHAATPLIELRQEDGVWKISQQATLP